MYSIVHECPLGMWIQDRLAAAAKKHQESLCTLSSKKERKNIIKASDVGHQKQNNLSHIDNFVINKIWFSEPANLELISTSQQWVQIKTYLYLYTYQIVANIACEDSTGLPK